MTADTVARAAATPSAPQPFAELGLTAAEYEKILGTLGRRPTGAELALYSVMWSEHCSYKSSKVHLRQLADQAPASTALLAGIGHNAGPLLGPDPDDPHASWRLWCWKRAVKRAWKTPPREIALRRLACAEAAGMTYREYTLEILERSVFTPAHRNA